MWLARAAHATSTPSAAWAAGADVGMKKRIISAIDGKRFISI
jgi:hypothetical protein